MSDTIDDFNSMKDHKKRLRAKFGVNCPQCAIKRPKAHPSILLPKQRCKVDGYVDPRPELTNDEWASA
ncbi:MAG: hypothetical protein ACXWJZ_00105 [Burkholderiaceae bacterium]